MVQGKVAVVGAGSAFFGPHVIVGLVAHDELAGLELALHDVDAAAVQRMGRFAELLIAEHRAEHRVEAGTDLGRCLDGADCVIVSVAVDREQSWARDRAIAQQHGIEHYAENGGPAAMFHAGRSLALILPIAREMERRCPDAWLLNYTNPVPRIGTALRRYTKVQSLGVCHQLDFGYFMVGCLLADELGIERPPDCRFHWTDERVALQAAIARAAKQRVRIVAAGLNHFTWMLSLTSRADGQDLYPLLHERSQTFDRAFEPLTRKIFELFDWFPVPGDCHLAEYLPFTHNPTRSTWARFDIQTYDLAWSGRQRRERMARVDTILETRDTTQADTFESERAEQLVAALLGGRHEDEALNVPNCGAIPNLPAEAIVEVPVVLERAGAQPEAVDALPDPIAELCRRQVEINELSVEGLVEGDRHKLAQALALDPMMDDPDLPERLVNEYWRASARYLAPLWE
jgi:alpha-galactosidase